MKYADTNHHKTLEPECARTFRGIHPYMVYTPCPCSKGSQKGPVVVLLTDPHGPTHPIHDSFAISLLGKDVLRLVRLLEFSYQPFQVQSKRARCDTAEAVVALVPPCFVLAEEIAGLHA